MIGGKYPSMLEKLWVSKLGWVLSCVEVKLANSRARIKPVMVIRRAESLSSGDIVIICVFVGGTLDTIISPARILP